MNRTRAIAALKRTWLPLKVLSVLFSATAFPHLALSANPIENFSPCFSTNTQIIWKAPTNDLPRRFWIYRRLPPRPFSASVISAAVNLASLEQYPASSTKPFFIWSAPNPCGMSYSIFSLEPSCSTISFSLPPQKYLSGNVPDSLTVIQWAFDRATQFGLEPALLSPKDVYTVTNSGGCGGTLTNAGCARGILLSRKLDGVSFFGSGNDGICGSEGFSIEFGGGGQTRSFKLAWPELLPDRQCATASPNEIIRCIRDRKVIVMPERDESNYFGRLNDLADSKTFTITKVTPYYCEGVFGDTPRNDEPPMVIAPIAELQAVGDFRNTKARIVAPILSSEANRLLNSVNR